MAACSRCNGRGWFLRDRNGALDGQPCNCKPVDHARRERRLLWGGVAVGIAAIVAVPTTLVLAVRRFHGDGLSKKQLLRRAGLPLELEPLVTVHAWTESRDNPNTALGIQERMPPGFTVRESAKEVDRQRAAMAALTAYERNQARIKGISPAPESHWTAGALGLYGAIPANMLAHWFGTDSLRDGTVQPSRLRQPVFATSALGSYLSRIVNGEDFKSLPREQQTLAALKRALSRPSRVTDTLWQASVNTKRNLDKAVEATDITWEQLNTPISMQALAELREYEPWA